MIAVAVAVGVVGTPGTEQAATPVAVAAVTCVLTCWAVVVNDVPTLLTNPKITYNNLWMQLLPLGITLSLGFFALRDGHLLLTLLLYFTFLHALIIFFILIVGDAMNIFPLTAMLVM